MRGTPRRVRVVLPPLARVWWGWRRLDNAFTVTPSWGLRDGRPSGTLRVEVLRPPGRAEDRFWTRWPHDRRGTLEVRLPNGGGRFVLRNVHVWCEAQEVHPVDPEAAQALCGQRVRLVLEAATFRWQA